MFGRKAEMITAAEALPGRDEPLEVTNEHFVLHRPIKPPFPAGTETVLFGMGCFWGAERAFWTLPGVYTTAVGYAGGFTPNPTYREVCTGLTGHAEVVLVVYDPRELAFAKLLTVFWESHDPTQGMRQGNDRGTQYRSIILHHSDEQRELAERSRDAYAERLREAGFGAITTTIEPAGEFYFAETYHQQYLARNPGGYCGIAGTGVACPAGLGVAGR